MATEPDNDLVVIASSDTTLPNTGYANKLVPESTLLTTGYDKGQAVTAENLNYILNNLAQHIQYCEELIVQQRMPIGSVYENSSDSTNPTTLFGYGVWESFAEGQTLVGVGSFTDTNDDNIVWAVGDTAGEYYHTMTEAELFAHTHTYSGTTASDGEHTHEGVPLVSADTDRGAANASLFSIDDAGSTGAAGVHTHTYSGTTDSTGSTTAFNVMQPTIAVYRWKRIS